MVVALSACGHYIKTEDAIEANKIEADKALQEIAPSQKERKSSLIINDRPWFGSTAIPIQNGEPLPASLLREDSIVLTFERPLSLREIAQSIQAATGIRIAVAQTQSQEGTVDEGLMRFIPPEGREVADGKIVWQGSLNEILDQVSDSFDADWHYNGRRIQLSRQISKTFMLHSLAGNIVLDNQLENEEDDDSNSLPQISFATQATLEIWEEIENAVSVMLEDKGSLSLSPSTGTITVSGPPSLVSRVEDYLREQNRMRLRRVAVAVKVLAVETSNVNSVTLRLNSILERALEGKPFELQTTAGGLTTGILRSLPQVDAVTGFSGADASGTLTTPDADVITASLEASEDIEKASVAQAGAIVTLSDIPAPLQIGQVISFLERVTTTIDEGDVTTSLEPGEVNIGLTMNILPRVIEENRVLLRLALGIKDAQTPFKTFSAGDSSIQLPEVETTGFVQNAVLASGETLILAGFERNQAGLEREGTPGGLFTGGSKSAEKTKEVTILLITAEILPEEPLTISGR